MRILYLSLFMLFYGCSCVKEIIHIENIKMKNEYSELIENIIHVGRYSPDMETGENFIYLLPQGIPFNIQDIMQLQQSGDAVLSDLQAIDKLYIASQFTDQIFICDSTLHLSNQKMSSLNFEEKDLYKLTSPTFNGSFLYSTVYPLLSDSCIIWSSFNHQSHRVATIENKRQTIQVPIPLIKATGEVSILLICRPWAHLNDISKLFSNKKIAIIEGIILSRNFKIEAMHKCCKIRIYRNKEKKHKIINSPISTHINYSNCIIGYYCRIL